MADRFASTNRRAKLLADSDTFRDIESAADADTVCDIRLDTDTNADAVCFTRLDTNADASALAELITAGISALLLIVAIIADLERAARLQLQKSKLQTARSGQRALAIAKIAIDYCFEVQTSRPQNSS